MKNKTSNKSSINLVSLNICKKCPRFQIRVDNFYERYSCSGSNYYPEYSLGHRTENMEFISKKIPHHCSFSLEHLLEKKNEVDL